MRRNLIALLAALALVASAAYAQAEDAQTEPGALANVAHGTCTQRLVRMGTAFSETEENRIAFRGPLAGIAVAFVGRDRSHAELDCRLALSVAAWAPVLRASGIVGIRHLSAFRRGAVNAQTGRTSGHAAGMAIDVRYFDREDGSTWDVTVDWGERSRGAPPCGDSAPSDAETTPMRKLVCDAVRARRFQVVVTPNRDDDHADHVHLELVPGVTWTYAR